MSKSHHRPIMFTIIILFFLCTLCSTTGAKDGCPDGSKRIVYPNGTADCFDCRRCPAGTIKTKNCSVDHDTECTKCYISAQFGDVGNTCNPCGVCYPSFYRQKNCTQFNDTICSLCPNGTFSATQNVERCSKCVICEPGSYLQKNCTKFKDTVCTPCQNGTFSATQNVDRCSKCGNCTGMIIKTECTAAADVVCKEKEISLETADVIANVAGILEGIATIIIIVVIIIKHRKQFNKSGEDSALAQAMLCDVQAHDRNMDETQAEKETEVIPDEGKLKEDLKEYMDYIGVLVMGVAEHQGDSSKRDKAARKGQKSREQTRPIIVLRIGRDYGITALQTLKKELNPGQGEHKTGYTKLKADNVYIEFHTDDNVIKCRVSSDTPVFEDDDLDIVVLKIKQDDSEPSSIHDPPVLKLTASDLLQESELHLCNLKTKISNGKEREFNFKKISLRGGYDSATNILIDVLENTMLKYIQHQNKSFLKISINELGSNIYTKGSEHLENISDGLKNNKELKEIISNPTDPKDVTTIFVSGEYSSGCPGFTYDNTGNLHVYCIFTHRVPRIFDVLNKNDQKLYFTDIQEVTAGTKITAIYKALRKANQKRLINAVFDSDN